jgi:NADPH:quinone reductase-like Zn-dependent oxidoreductase
MKAIVLNEYGDSSHLKLAEIPEPKPGAGEIKVKVAAASINPIDWKPRSGDYKAFMPVQFPFVPGKGMQTHVDSKRLAGLAEAVMTDKLKLPIAKRFSLAEATSAQRLAEAGGISKVLLRV